LAQRSRKRRKRTSGTATVKAAPSRKPAQGTPSQRAAPTRPVDPREQTPPAHLPQASRSERRNAEVRAALKPIAAGERPKVIVVSTAVAAIVGLANVIAFAAGAKIGGKSPATGGIVVFTALMAACAIGLWRMWYGAVLGFMALLAIVATLFALLLIEASNVLGLLVALVMIVGSGYLFFKLVRVLSRIQMPKYPGR
jgi:hypothetical protein